MDFCKKIVVSGDTTVPQGAVGVKCSKTNVSLPSSVRAVEVASNASVSLNSGIAFYSGWPSQISGSLPSSLRWLSTGQSVNGNNLSPNNGLITIGYSAFEGRLCMSGNHNSTIPKSVKFIADRAYRNSLISGVVKCKTPFIEGNAFEYCSGVTSFNFDVSDVENTNSYILNPFYTYKEYCDGYHDGWRGPAIQDFPLKSIFLKGYEWVYLDMIRNGNFSNTPRLNKIEIIGNGNTKVGWGGNEYYSPIYDPTYDDGQSCYLFANEVIIGDGVKTLRSTIMAVVPDPDPVYPDIPSTAHPDRYNKAARNTRIRLGKDIEAIYYAYMGHQILGGYWSFYTERLEITKDDGIMLPNETSTNINKIFGGCTAIYVPSKVYQAYLAADNWSGMASRINSY